MKVYRLIWSDGSCDYQEWFSSKARAETRAKEIATQDGGTIEDASHMTAFDIAATKHGFLAFLNENCGER